MHCLLPLCQSKKKSYSWGLFNHMVVEPHAFLLFCREWVIFCLPYCLWWMMNQRHFGVLLLWWNALDPILIVTKMACTLNFLHYLRFISCSLSPWQAAYTHTIVDFWRLRCSIFVCQFYPLFVFSGLFLALFYYISICIYVLKLCIH